MMHLSLLQFNLYQVSIVPEMFRLPGTLLPLSVGIIFLIFIRMYTTQPFSVLLELFKFLRPRSKSQQFWVFLYLAVCPVTSVLWVPKEPPSLSLCFACLFEDHDCKALPGTGNGTWLHHINIQQSTAFFFTPVFWDFAHKFSYLEIAWTYYIISLPNIPPITAILIHISSLGFFFFNKDTKVK